MNIVEFDTKPDPKIYTLAWHAHIYIIFFCFILNNKYYLDNR